MHDVRRPSAELHDPASASEPGTTRRSPRPLAEATHDDLERLAAGQLDAVLVADRYRVERALGRGGMASVYAAHDLNVDRPVALKILSADCSGHPLLLARFSREARLHGRIHHPNVVEVLDYGTSDTGLIYLVMELLEGEDLGCTLARLPALPWPRARELMLQICAGLGAVHAAGVVHRDLKPSNCFKIVVDGHESICLVDFGIAAAIDEPRSERLTLDDQIVGTPEYMSPEQARGERVDQRSDIYAAGLLLGEMLTGSLPFRAATSSAMLAAQIYEPAPTLRSLLPPNVLIPAALEPVYARALAKQPEQRFATIDQLAAALRAIAPGGPVLCSGSFERAPLGSRPALETNTCARPQPLRRPASKRKWSLALAIAVAMLIGAAGALALASSLVAAAN
ncbi:MAG TPA: serine/threonine-protein kinase [Enhygromyxa sp.]|nr:serine/threonine-protein kinase [Enhygromyxa sp.]